MTLRCRIFGHDWWPNGNHTFPDEGKLVCGLTCSRCDETVRTTDPFPYLRGER